jgi:hypothetical protein
LQDVVAVAALPPLFPPAAGRLLLALARVMQSADTLGVVVEPTAGATATAVAVGVEAAARTTMDMAMARAVMAMLSW